MKVTTKRIIIQPHSDDALFSAFDAIVKNKATTTILTVENNPIRIEEDDALYNHLGVRHEHLDVEFKDDSYYSFFKDEDGKKRNLKMTPSTAAGHLTEYFGAEKLKEIGDAIENYIVSNAKSGDELYIPAGIGHPFHLFVSKAVERAVSKNGLSGVSVIYYREFPHSFKRRSQEQMENFLQGHKLVNSVVLPQHVYDMKWMLAKKYYKSQSGLLFFEQGYIKKNLAEEYYEKLPEL